MKQAIQATCLAAMLTFAVLASNVDAQTGPITGPTTGQTTGPAMQVNEPAQQLSEAALATFLRGSHPELKTFKITDREGNPGKEFSFSVRVGEETRRVVVRSIIGSKQITLLMPLTRRLKKMADLSSYRAGPARLAYLPHEDDGQFTLLAVLAVDRPTSTKELQKTLTDMLKGVESSRKVWGEVR